LINRHKETQTDGQTDRDIERERDLVIDPASRKCRT